MKAVLVIDDMPNCCTACPFFEFINDYEDDCRTRCNVEYGRINEYGTDVRPKWCPLKPMPQMKADENGNVSAQKEWIENEWDFISGWNACIDEIMGETE